LGKIEKEILKRKLDYALVYNKFTDKKVLKLYLKKADNRKRTIERR
jgi:hypothetical protein